MDVLRFRDVRASSKDIRVLSRESVVAIKFTARKHNGNTNREGHIVTFLAERGYQQKGMPLGRGSGEFQPVLVHCIDQ